MMVMLISNNQHELDVDAATNKTRLHVSDHERYLSISGRAAQLTMLDGARASMKSLSL
jgi:hypothetical protein